MVAENSTEFISFEPLSIDDPLYIMFSSGIQVGQNACTFKWCVL